MDELKPCPFCGGEAFLKGKHGPYGWFLFAQCEICGAESKKHLVTPDKTDDDSFWLDIDVRQKEARIVRAWNKRCEPCQTD